jgi:hypothetical protein
VNSLRQSLWQRFGSARAEARRPNAQDSPSSREGSLLTPSQRAAVQRYRVAWRIAGLLVLVLALLIVLVGFSDWVRITNIDASDGQISGWGMISGVRGMAGENINDVIASLDGFGSYRPALLSAVLAALVAFAALGMIWRQSRIAAAAVLACAVLLAAWGLYRALVPGDVGGVVEEGASSAAVGPWSTFGLAVLILVSAVGGLREKPAANNGRQGTH